MRVRTQSIADALIHYMANALWSEGRRDYESDDEEEASRPCRQGVTQCETYTRVFRGWLLLACTLVMQWCNVYARIVNVEASI